MLSFQKLNSSVLGKWARLLTATPGLPPELKRVAFEHIPEKQREKYYRKSARLGIRLLIVAMFPISYTASY